MDWRAFFRDFRAYWSGDAISARMDDWTHRVRANTGRALDPKVEQRIADRAKHKAD